MSIGFSGNMGFPLPANWSFNQIQTARVGSLDINRDVHKTGSDMGVWGVKGSPGSATVDEFIAYIRRVHEVAVAYRNSMPGFLDMDTNEMVLTFLRHPKYTNLRWWGLLGVVDGFVYKGWLGFLAFAQERILNRIDNVNDPTSGVVDFHINHLAAACVGVWLKGKPLAVDGTPPPTGIADFAGWGGDWIQHYGEWQDANALEPGQWRSGLDFCRAETPGEMVAGKLRSAFKLRDLLEDVMNMRAKIPAPVVSRGIVDEIIDTFQGLGRLVRYQNFFSRRFNSHPAALKLAALEMLGTFGPAPTDADDVKLAAYRTALMLTQSENPVLPFDMSPDQLSSFCDGLVEVIVTKVEAEAEKNSGS